MADERFSWSRAGADNGSIELKRRNIWRILTKDSTLNCLVCRKRPKKNEKCYYPATGLASTNKVIGHVACVDERTAALFASASVPSTSAAHSSLTHSSLAQPLTFRAELTRRNIGNSELKAVEASGGSVTDIARPQPLSGNHSVDWYVGWQAGVKFRFDRAQQPPDGASAEWYKGWYEGFTFIEAHQSHAV